MLSLEDIRKNFKDGNGDKDAHRSAVLVVVDVLGDSFEPSPARKFRVIPLQGWGRTGGGGGVTFWPAVMWVQLWNKTSRAVGCGVRLERFLALPPLADDLFPPPKQHGAPAYPTIITSSTKQSSDTPPASDDVGGVHRLHDHSAFGVVVA
ncbi:hypothetical protein HPB47_018468 [Ixodes persulcatus]|uniref:Uncharacterized protein n=1 Tax=Ixodes persulcatus TaxID=34615 RepID=A0AC60QKN8_IXOPE|nr:hypothetical protein HPB47_018468 [Ixodes persulcatus]